MKLSEGFEALKDCDGHLDLLGKFSFFPPFPPKKTSVQSSQTSSVNAAVPV